ncbi:hypothetical protein Lepto7375DRAFT_3745 [Leptolyngbya sp. PCC 7375]|nr:hypothetical protein Lepto7375DRAFT_3745 [Leptolyngbya sp. PCC 7375]
MLKGKCKEHNVILRIAISFLIGIGIIFLFNPHVLAQASNSEGSSSIAVVGVILGGLFGIIGGIAAAIVTSTQKIKELKEEFRLHEKEQIRKEIAQLRRDYLNPLKLSADELKERLKTLKNKQSDGAEAARVRPWFVTIKDYITRDYRPDKNFSFSNWCNGGEGYFAVSTLYLTLAYFATATRIREEMPFTILVPKYNEYIKILTNHIEKTRMDFGGTYGIWEEIQDSIGRIALRSDGDIMDYKAFYTALMDDRTCSAFLRMADYYVDFKDKDFASIISSLEALLDEFDHDGVLYKELIEA